MATKEMTHLGTYVVPKVNLLPPEIDEKKAQQRAYVAMGAVVVAAIGAVGFIYAAEASRVGKAQQELTVTQRQGTQLTADRQKLAYVDEIYATVDANEAMLKQAVARRIPWSRNLHDLSLTMPDGVWLTKISIIEVFDPEARGTNADPVLADAGLGTVTFEGRAFTFNNLASWLDVMSRTKAYDNPYFSKSELKVPTAEAPPSDRPYIEWTATSTISKAAVDSKSVTK